MNEVHRPEPEENWHNRQFDEYHNQILEIEYKKLLKNLYPKDNSKKFRKKV